MGNTSSAPAPVAVTVVATPSPEIPTKPTETIMLPSLPEENEEDITVDVLNDTTNNQDHRAEEKWHQSLDDLARGWRDSCIEQCKEHDKAGYGANKKHLIFGLPGPVTAIATTAVAALWESPDARFVIVPLSALAAIFSSVHVFMDLAGKAQRHWNYSAQYGGMASKIGFQLGRDVDFRRPADEFLAETRAEIGNLNGNAPQLPGTGCCGCSHRGGPVPGLETEEEVEERRAINKQQAKKWAETKAARHAEFIASNANDAA